MELNQMLVRAYSFNQYLLCFILQKSELASETDCRLFDFVLLQPTLKILLTHHMIHHISQL